MLKNICIYLGVAGHVDEEEGQQGLEHEGEGEAVVVEGALEDGQLPGPAANGGSGRGHVTCRAAVIGYLACTAATHCTTTTLSRKPDWQVNSSSFLSS